MTVSWDPVQTVKRGEQIEYLLQSQYVGKDQDFVQVSYSNVAAVIKYSKKKNPNFSSLQWTETKVGSKKP